MPKLLFLSNGNKPNEEEYNYIGEEKLTNFSIPNVEAAKKIGIDITIGVNRKNPDKLTCVYPVDFYNAEIYRNPFNIFEVRKAYKNACNQLKMGDYFAIHCNTPIGGFIGRVAGHKCGIKKVIYTAHGFHFYKGAPLINWLLFYPIERFLAHYTDAIITINKEDFKRAQSFKLRNNGKVFYVPGVGIDTDSYSSINYQNNKRDELGIPLDATVIISVGDLNHNKNNIVVIEALKNVPNVHYIVCGQGPLRDKLISAAEPIKDRIHFLGYRTDVKELMAISDIFIMPSFREGLSRSIMEAMASGLPVIASNIRGNNDLIQNGKGGFLCNPKDVNGFATSIISLADDKNKRIKMKQYNIERIKKYDISVVINELFSIYKSVLL